MRNLLALLGLALVAFAIIGWYQGWYKFQTATQPDGNKSITIDLNNKQIQTDINKGKEAVVDVFKK